MLGKMHLSKEDVKDIIQILKNHDKHISELIGKIDENGNVDLQGDLIQTHFTIENLIKALNQK